MSGIPTISPSPAQPTGKICPVASWRFRAQRLTRTVATTPTRIIASTIAEPSSKMGRGQEHATVIQKGRVADRHTVAHPGQRQHDQPPENDLEQDRDVAGELDPDGNDTADQIVVREPEHARREADARRGENAHGGDEDGVERADHEGLPVGRGRRVVDEPLVDVEVGGVEEEAVAGGKPGRFHVRDRVGNDEGGEQRQPEHHEKLEDDAASALVGPDAADFEPAVAGGRRLLGHGRAALPATGTSSFV